MTREIHPTNPEMWSAGTDYALSMAMAYQEVLRPVLEGAADNEVHGWAVGIELDAHSMREWSRSQAAAYLPSPTESQGVLLADAIGENAQGRRPGGTAVRRLLGGMAFYHAENLLWAIQWDKLKVPTLATWYEEHDEERKETA